MVHLRTLREIHCCAIRSMDRKSWTYARRLHLLGSHIRVPVRSVISAQTRHSTRSLILMARKSPHGAVRHCARTKKPGKDVRFHCELLRLDDPDDILTTTLMTF